MMGRMPPDDARRTPGPTHTRRGGRWAALALLALLAGGTAGCAGMPPPPPPPPTTGGDGYSGGSNFGGPPMDFGPQE